jgi:hypothetical protein
MHLRRQSLRRRRRFAIADGGKPALLDTSEKRQQ